MDLYSSGGSINQRANFNQNLASLNRSNQAFNTGLRLKRDDEISTAQEVQSGYQTTSGLRLAPNVAKIPSLYGRAGESASIVKGAGIGASAKMFSKVEDTGGFVKGSVLRSNYAVQAGNTSTKAIRAEDSFNLASRANRASGIAPPARGLVRSAAAARAAPAARTAASDAAKVAKGASEASEVASVAKTAATAGEAAAPSMLKTGAKIIGETLATTAAKGTIVGIGAALEVGKDISRGSFGNNAEQREGGIIGLVGSGLQVAGLAAGATGVGIPLAFALEAVGTALAIGGGIVEGIGDFKDEETKEATAQEDVTAQKRAGVSGQIATQVVGRAIS